MELKGLEQIDTLDGWATAHRGLAFALAERRPASVASLTEATMELRSLVRRLTER